MSIDHLETDPNNQLPDPQGSDDQVETFTFPPAWKAPEKKGWSPKTKLFSVLGAVAAGAVLSGSLFLLPHTERAGNNDQEPNEGKEPVATAPASPSPEASIGASTGEVDPSSAEVLKQTISIEAMESMDTTTFAGLPIADRAAYILSRAASDNVTIASASMATDVMNILSDPAGITGSYWSQTETMAYSESDQEDGVKDYLATQYYTTTNEGDIIPSVQEGMNDILTNGGQGTGVTTSLKFESAGQLQSGKDLFGKNIQWLNISVRPQDDPTQTVGEEVTIQTVRTPIELSNGTTVVFYSQGLTADGKASPVSGYPY